MNIDVKDANGVTKTVAVSDPGRAAAAASKPVVLCTEDLAALSGDSEYETVAASQTNQVLGAAGAIGDMLSHMLIVPATTSPGAVTIADGAGAAITVFAGGASSIGSLVPFTVALGMKSLAGGWKVTTGANVSVIAVGNFS